MEATTGFQKSARLKRGAIPHTNVTLQSVTDTTATVIENIDSLKSSEKSTENIIKKVSQEDVRDADSDTGMLLQWSDAVVQNVLIQPAATSSSSSSNQTCAAESSESTEYSIHNLREDLKKFPLPEAWAFVFHNEEIHLHHWSPEFTTTLTVLIQGDMTAKILVSKHVARPADSMDLTSFHNITRSLHLLGQQQLCQGTGINGSRAESCHLFLSDWKSDFCRTYGNKCLPCQILRKKEINAVKKRKLFQKNRVTKLQATLKATKKKNLRLRKKTQKLKAEVESAKKKCAAIREDVFNKEISALPEEQQEALKACFAAAKVKSARGRRYTLNWVYECLLIRIKSSKAYEHLRSHNILPVPTVDTLNKYIRKMNGAYGFNAALFQCLKRKASEMAPEDRRGTLLVDEMKLTQGIYFDKKTCQYTGFTDLGKYTPLHQTNKTGDHALVLMFQPLRGNWVQALACFLSKGCASSTVLHHILLECVILLEKSGFSVDVVTTDGATWNRGMWRCFGISDENVSCIHPFDANKKLWFASDFPHLVKNLRNFVVAKPEIWTPDGTVKLKHWEALLEVERPGSYNLKVAHKLTQDHIKPQYYQKMNVPLAFQIPQSYPISFYTKAISLRRKYD